MDEQKKRFAMAALRRASYKWPGRYNAVKRCKIGRNQYQCEKCNNIFPKKEMQLDHINPVVNPETGFVGFDEWIDRLLVPETMWQNLCKPCHLDKTRKENEIRQLNNRAGDVGFKKKKKVDKSKK